MHISDIKAIYAVKFHLQSHLTEQPSIAALAKEAGMSGPKLRKLFKQTFGKGVFKFYQSARMQEAARLLSEKTAHRIRSWLPAGVYQPGPFFQGV